MHKTNEGHFSASLAQTLFFDKLFEHPQGYFLDKLFEHPQGYGTSRQNSRDNRFRNLGNTRKLNFRGEGNQLFDHHPFAWKTPHPHPTVPRPKKLIFAFLFSCLNLWGNPAIFGGQKSVTFKPGSRIFGISCVFVCVFSEFLGNENSAQSFSDRSFFWRFSVFFALWNLLRPLFFFFCFWRLSANQVM